MKVIIAGGRYFDDMAKLAEAVHAFQARRGKITEIVSGGQRAWQRRYHAAPDKLVGADYLGELYAHANGIPVKVFPAQWNTFGLSAGPKRNRQMAEYADALIAMPGGRGTANMIYEARKRGLLVLTR